MSSRKRDPFIFTLRNHIKTLNLKTQYILKGPVRSMREAKNISKKYKNKVMRQK